MRTAELSFNIEEARHEQLISELLQMGAEAFQQEEDRLRAYLPASRLSPEFRDHLHRWLKAHGIQAHVQENYIADQNWNAKWEESIQPLEVGHFVIAPTWAEKPLEGNDDRVLVNIDPKSSFGTGYHQSTRLILRLLPDSISGGEKVLDAGTGTGILAIAALKLGAAEAVTFDTDEWAQENAVENFSLNHVSDRVTFRSGSMDEVQESDFDVILANINREVLKLMMPAFRDKLREGGRLLMSGLLKTDKVDMLDVLSEYDFAAVNDLTENEWWAVVARAD